MRKADIMALQETLSRTGVGDMSLLLHLTPTRTGNLDLGVPGGGLTMVLSDAL